MNQRTVSSYSARGSKVYEDPKNLTFLYGAITREFYRQVEFYPDDRIVLDLGCGTGFGFEALRETFEERPMQGIGIEPAQGMLDVAIEKFQGCPWASFKIGSFENIPLPDNSVDKIVSSLALHWVKSMDIAVAEMKRVLKPGGSMFILMIGRDDGAVFKQAIVKAQKKHLTFAQIMKTATLVQRLTGKKLEEKFSPFADDFQIRVDSFNDGVFGSFEDHMKWWTARSSPVIAEVDDKERFMQDLGEELEKMKSARGICFDTHYLWLRAKGKTVAN